MTRPAKKKVKAVKKGKTWWTRCDCGARIENVDPKSIVGCECGAILIPVTPAPAKRRKSRGK